MNGRRYSELVQRYRNKINTTRLQQNRRRKRYNMLSGRVRNITILPRIIYYIHLSKDDESRTLRNKRDAELFKKINENNIEKKQYRIVNWMH